MIVILKDRADERQVENLTTWLKSMNIGTHISRGSKHTIIGLIGNTTRIDTGAPEQRDIVSPLHCVQRLPEQNSCAAARLSRALPRTPSAA